MALNSTIYKVELQISDMDRHYYATHALTLARHPSETEERLMVRLLAFALYADDRLEFGKGISDEDEPALWRKAYTDEIELWIELGQPDEARIRKACGRSRQVVVINYGGNVGRHLVEQGRRIAGSQQKPHRARHLRHHRRRTLAAAAAWHAPAGADPGWPAAADERC
jgi:uncharacterized protein YaeQ